MVGILLTNSADQSLLVDCKTFYLSINTAKVLGVSFFIISQDSSSNAVYDAVPTGNVVKIVLGTVPIVSVYAFKNKTATWERIRLWSVVGWGNNTSHPWPKWFNVDGRLVGMVYTEIQFF